jgi:hypothetical protein
VLRLVKVHGQRALGATHKQLGGLCVPLTAHRCPIKPSSLDTVDEVGCLGVAWRKAFFRQGSATAARVDRVACAAGFGFSVFARRSPRLAGG